ncbi:MAG: hypothetical protein N2Z22_09855 [Turneriella sp.]|nr:hypothetical protein [Turneriella sp.]
MRQFRPLRDGHWLAILAAVMGLTCTGELDRFLAEDRPLSLQARVDMASPPQLDTGSQVFTFSVTLRIDRAGHYNIVHGSSCDGGKPPAGIPHTGTIGPNEDKNVAVSIQLNDIEEFGKYVVLCASDSGNYQKASQTIALQPMLDYLAQLNEATGQGLPLNSTIAEEFAIFQNDWTMGVSNRGQPSTVQNGVFRPLQFAAFIDPNDSYRIKFFVADYGNNRVIVFHRQPQPWGDTAAVVIGQPDFFSGDTNAGGGGKCSWVKLPHQCCCFSAGKTFYL